MCEQQFSVGQWVQWTGAIEPQCVMEVMTGHLRLRRAEFGIIAANKRDCVVIEEYSPPHDALPVPSPYDEAIARVTALESEVASLKQQRAYVVQKVQSHEETIKAQRETIDELKLSVQHVQTQRDEAMGNLTRLQRLVKTEMSYNAPGRYIVIQFDPSRPESMNGKESELSTLLAQGWKIQYQDFLMDSGIMYHPIHLLPPAFKQWQTAREVKRTEAQPTGEVNQNGAKPKTVSGTIIETDISFKRATETPDSGLDADDIIELANYEIRQTFETNKNNVRPMALTEGNKNG